MADAKPNPNHTDAAALSAGVVAAVLTIYLDPGEYGVMSLVISFALAIVTLAFVWRQRRLWDGSLAIGAIIGLALLPACGFFHEAALRDGIVVQLFKLDYDGINSAVADWMVARDWLILFPLIAGADMVFQRLRAKSLSQIAA